MYVYIFKVSLFSVWKTLLVRRIIKAKDYKNENGTKYTKKKWKKINKSK